VFQNEEFHDTFFVEITPFIAIGPKSRAENLFFYVGAFPSQPDHLSGILLDDVLDDFPTVSRDLAIALLELANKIVKAKNIEALYEAAA